MVGYITTVLVFLIICVTILLGIYMCFCSEHGTKMFADPGYEERIRKLENQVRELKEK